jgi:hypothetical protein
MRQALFARDVWPYYVCPVRFNLDPGPVEGAQR